MFGKNQTPLIFYFHFIISINMRRLSFFAIKLVFKSLPP
ncbi:hypothetical protein MBGDN05_00693, partial [Thermoplasmatales archaeon SCGC AB-539-N05]